MKRVAVVVSSLLAIILTLSTLAGAATPVSTTSAQAGEWVTIIVNGHIFAYPRSADHDAVVREINRVLGANAVTNLSGLSATGHTFSEAESIDALITFKAVVVVAAAFYKYVAIYPEFRLGLQYMARDVHAFVGGTMRLLMFGTGYDESCPMRLTPLFDVWHGVITWY